MREWGLGLGLWTEVPLGMYIMQWIESDTNSSMWPLHSSLEFSSTRASLCFSFPSTRFYITFEIYMPCESSKNEPLQTFRGMPLSVFEWVKIVYSHNASTPSQDLRSKPSSSLCNKYCVWRCSVSSAAIPRNILFCERRLGSLKLGADLVFTNHITSYLIKLHSTLCNSSSLNASQVSSQIKES